MQRKRSSGTKQKQFKYDPLNRRRKEFRLIDLHSGQGRDPLECSLRHASLRNKSSPKYETISYCWGKPKPRVSLVVNGGHLLVPKSCDAALRRLRFPDHSRTLWIDALCIDQSNHNERAHQVGMMGDVYRRSRGNLIYLGQGDTTTKRALQYIKHILSKIDQDPGVLLGVGDAWTVPDSGLQYSVSFEALGVFYSLPWFRSDSLLVPHTV